MVVCHTMIPPYSLFGVQIREIHILRYPNIPNIFQIFTCVSVSEIFFQNPVNWKKKEIYSGYLENLPLLLLIIEAFIICVTYIFTLVIISSLYQRSNLNFCLHYQNGHGIPAHLRS